MADEVLSYESPKRQRGVGGRIVKMVVMLSVVSLVTLAQAVPTSFGHGSRPGFIMSETGYGWLGTFLRVTHRFFPAAPMTTSYEVFWRPLVGTVVVLGAMWVACIDYCRRIRPRQ